jgi:tRNA threonylcarbamoyladenosine biosynthesis protein TsaB
MKLLALDTSTNACSVAVQFGDRRAARHAIAPREHSRLLIPMISEVLAESGVELGELDAIVLGNGPGSFIGVRIAASVAQGMAFGSGLHIVPVSSLAAVAAEAFAVSSAERLLVAQDAHREEVYLAAFERGDGGLPVARGGPVLHPVAPIERLGGIRAEAGARWRAAGAGWRRYPELLALNERLLDGIVEPELPQAVYLLELGERARAAGEAVEPGALIPAYVRMRVAREPAEAAE